MQDRSWFKHVQPSSLPETLQEILKSPFRTVGEETPQLTFEK